MGGLLIAWLPGLAALLAVLPILTYVYLNFGDTPAQTTAQAQDILVQFRVPHHALVSWWFDATAVIKILLILCALLLVRKQRLVWLLGVPFGVGLLLTLAQVISGSNFLALLFPWRVSTFLVPLSSSLILAWLVQKTGERYVRAASDRINTRPSTRYENTFPAPTAKPGPLSEAVVRAASLNLIGLLVLVGLVRMTLDFQRKAQAAEAPLLAFVSSHRQPGEVYLTPVKMQEFRLETGSPVFVDFKSIPYQDEDVLEWYRRVKVADEFYKNQDCSLLTQFSTQEEITHVVLPLEEFTNICTGLAPVYQDQHFAVYPLAKIP